MDPNSNQNPQIPSMAPREPQPPASPPPAGGQSQQSSYGAPSPNYPPQQPVQPPTNSWNQPNFYGAASQQPVISPQSTNLPPPPPQGPVALTLPMWIGDHWKILLLSITGVILVLTIAFQMIYPSSRMLPGTQVDGVTLDYMRKQDAVEKLNEAYGNIPLAIYFGSNQAAFQTPKYKDVGIGVNTEDYLAPFEYPWYLRIIPSSFFWAGGLNKPGALEYVYNKNKIDSYIQAQVGDDCTIPARDATLKLVSDKLQVIPSQPGGVCDITRFQQVLATTQPKAAGENKVTIDIRETAALVDDDKARLLANALNDRASTPMPISVAGGSQTVAGRSVLGWLDFKSFIPETPAGQARDEDRIRNGSKLTFSVNRDRMGTFMAGDIGKKLTIKPGVNRVTTRDFTVQARVDGQPGRELDRDRTAVTVENYLNKKANNAIAEPRAVPPSTIYTRSYSPTSTGFRALLTQWPEEHGGTWAMSFSEVSGTQPYRKASYRGDQQMLAAGVEAGYIGYAVVLAEKDNTILSSDSIAGRSPHQCFTDMIEKSDMDCIGGFFTKIGHQTILARGNELGLRGTTFGVTNTRTTTDDLTGFLNKAYLTQLAPTAGGGRVMSTMQSTRMKEGIQAGLDKGNTANMAGEIGNVRNDAAVVYSPKGVYLFIIMTDGASWKDIADLARKVEGLHQVLPPKTDS